MANWNFTSKDKVNARTARTLDSVKGETLTLIGYSDFERVNKDTGEVITVGALKTTDGMFTTISRTAMETLEDVLDYVADEYLESVDIVVNSQTSKNGRAFLTISLV